MNKLFAILFLLLIGLLGLFYVEQGRDFALGVLFGVGLYQLAYYAKHKTFID